MDEDKDVPMLGANRHRDRGVSTDYPIQSSSIRGSVGVNFSQSIPLLHARSAVAPDPRKSASAGSRLKNAAEIDRSPAKNALTKSDRTYRIAFAEKSILGYTY